MKYETVKSGKNSRKIVLSFFFLNKFVGFSLAFIFFPPRMSRENERNSEPFEKIFRKLKILKKNSSFAFYVFVRVVWSQLCVFSEEKFSSRRKKNFPQIEIFLWLFSRLFCALAKIFSDGKQNKKQSKSSLRS